MIEPVVLVSHCHSGMECALLLLLADHCGRRGRRGKRHCRTGEGGLQMTMAHILLLGSPLATGYRLGGRARVQSKFDCQPTAPVLNWHADCIADVRAGRIRSIASPAMSSAGDKARGVDTADVIVSAAARADGGAAEFWADHQVRRKRWRCGGKLREASDSRRMPRG